MRALGLDIGARRIGVAVSDPGGTVATPLKVLDARMVARDITPLRRLVEDYEVDLIVAGLPLTLAGDEGPQAVEVRRRAEELACLLRLPLELWDERLSTTEAARSMSASGVSARDSKGAVDMVAAALILQGFLDSRRVAGSDGDAG
jgi:putative Holliday junction resolvase